MAAETILSLSATGGELAESSVFTIVFIFFGTEKGKAFLMEHSLIGTTPVQDFVFPLVALIQWMLAGLAIYDFLTAKNRNFSKTSTALLLPTKAMVNTTAITIGVLLTKHVLPLAFGISVPYLFLGMIAAYTLWTAGSMAYHFYKMRQAPEGSALREAHRAGMIANVIPTVVGIILCVVVGALFAASISSPFGLAVYASIGVGVLIGAMAASLYLKYRAKKQLEPKNGVQKFVPEQEIKNLVSNMDKSKIDHWTKPEAEGDKNDRFYVREFKPLLKSAKRADNKLLDGKDNHLVTVFTGIIGAKIQDLREQMEKASENRSAFFNFFGIDERQKRQAKISGLFELKLLVGEVTGNNKIQASDIDKIIDNNPKIFQSFKREKSDVELIFDAAREYFTQPKSLEFTK